MANQTPFMQLAPIQWIDIDARGRPMLTTDNMRLLLDRHGITIRYNEMTNRKEYFIPGLSPRTPEYSTVAIARITDWMTKENMKTTQGIVDGIFSDIAGTNCYHPVREMIDGVVWDGQSRIGDVFDCLTTENEPLRDLLMLKWMIGAVAAIYEPKFSAEGVLVLQGPQGIGKTRFMLSLLPENLQHAYRQGMHISNHKDSIALCNGCWITEIGELGHTFRKSDIDFLKAFITQSIDSYRRPYAHDSNDYPRRTVFIGTVNDEKFLSDNENRRFWTLPVSAIKPYNGDVLQLWAEVKTYYDSGVKWWLEPHDKQLLGGQQQAFEVVAPIVELLQGRIDPSGREESMNASQVIEKFSNHKVTRADQRAVADYLRKLGCGFTKKHSTFHFSIIDATTTIAQKNVVDFSLIKRSGNER